MNKEATPKDGTGKVRNIPREKAKKNRDIPIFSYWQDQYCLILHSYSAMGRESFPLLVYQALERHPYAWGFELTIGEAAP